MILKYTNIYIESVKEKVFATLASKNMEVRNRVKVRVYIEGKIKKQLLALYIVLQGFTNY